uniref:Uncharacterized protein n=1 Tax=Chryseobacterium endophyticum TaxID=1854762 RepID=A0AAU6WNQ9_9FLAO
MEKSIKNVAAILCCLITHGIYAKESVGEKRAGYFEMSRSVYFKTSDSLKPLITEKNRIDLEKNLLFRIITTLQVDLAEQS